LEPSQQLFCVMAALIAGGYDTGAELDTVDDTREQVRRLLAKKKIPIVPEIAKFYSDHRIAGDPGADLGQYVSLVLLLGPSPDFHFLVPQTDLPPDAKGVMGLVPLLRRFYLEANLSDLWERVEPRYKAAVARYSDPIRRMVALADAYFRFASGSYLGLTYTIEVDLLGAPEQVHARIYGLNYHVVVTPSKSLKIGEIRHQYLHFLLDPLAAKYAQEIQQKSVLKGLARAAPSLAADFKEDFALLLTECLIRASELRMDRRPKSEAEKTASDLTASGLILVPYFYSALEDYELQEASMRVVYKQMVLAIDPRSELKRLASVKFAPPAAQAEPTTAVSEEARLLDQGDNSIYRGQYREARAAFQTVLEKFDPRNERALFGLAVTASNTRKPDLAEEYFQKTLEAAHDLRRVTWSHIYLGRLYDLKGNREDALRQYRAASLTAGPYPEALLAVRGGLRRPFGSKD
jgi:tetratricopeptide (TPR) repeat protein